MPWDYAGAAEGITPSAGTVASGDDNWTLDAASAGVGEITEVYWGGETTTSTAMRTRVARSDQQGTSPTALTVEKLSGVNTPTHQIDLVATYASGAQPTMVVPSLIAMGWNAHGGMFRWVAGPREGFFLITGESLDLISCRNAIGVGQSTYGVHWKEWSQ